MSWKAVFIRIVVVVIIITVYYYYYNYKSRGTHNNIGDGPPLELEQRHDCEAQSCHQSDHVTAKWCQLGYLSTCRACNQSINKYV